MKHVDFDPNDPRVIALVKEAREFAAMMRIRGDSKERRWAQDRLLNAAYALGDMPESEEHADDADPHANCPPHDGCPDTENCTCSSCRMARYVATLPLPEDSNEGP